MDMAMDWLNENSINHLVKGNCAKILNCGFPRIKAKEIVEKSKLINLVDKLK